MITPSPPSLIVQTVLQDGGLAGGSSGFGLSHSRMPDLPDKYVSVYDTTPLLFGRLQSLSYLEKRQFGIMVMVRSPDYDSGWLQIESIRDAMASVVGQVFTVGTVEYKIHNLRLSSGPVWIGPEKEEKKREQFTINWLLKLERQ